MAYEKAVHPPLNSLMDSCVIEGVELTELPPIGSGAYAKVYRGNWKGIPVAVKKLHDVFFDETVAKDHQIAMRGTFDKELCLNMRLRHPNIIQFLGVYCTPEDRQRRAPMMVMELMDTTLEKRLLRLRLEEGVRMHLHEVVDITADVAAALVYLHEQVPNPIAHRDLAPKNILLSMSGAEGRTRAKLADLGVAKAFSESVRHTIGPGTPAFMPPEVHLTKNYSPSPVDIYSFGVTLLEMCSGVDSNPSEALRSIDQLQYTIVPEEERRAASFSVLGGDHLLKELICTCLESSPESRPKAREILHYLNWLKESEEYVVSLQAAIVAANAHLAPKSCEACNAREETFQVQLRQKDIQLKNLQDEIERFKQFQKQHLASLQKGVETFMVLPPESQSYGPVEEVDDDTAHAGDKTWHHSKPTAVKHMQHSKSFRLVGNSKVTVAARRRSWTEPIDLENLGLSATTAIPLPSQDGADLKRKHLPPTNPPSNTPLTTNEVRMFENISYRNVAVQQSQRFVDSASSATASSADPSINEAVNPSDYLQPSNPTQVVSRGKTTWPNGQPGKRVGDQSLYTTQSGEAHLYSEIPPPPPPRPPTFSFRHRRTKSWNFPKSKARISPPLQGMPMLVEINEHGVSTKSTARRRGDRMVQSMRARLQSPMADRKRPSLMRLSSRGDLLISRVTKSYKSKKPTELNVSKGELVKVTNSAMDKDWSLAVTTVGKSGSVKKKHLEQVQPALVVYDVTRPVKSRQSGVLNRIAVRGNRQNMWVSPIESQKVTITPSSLHSGEVNMLVKITDYVLCCTDDEPRSSFEIDLHMQRLAKLTGYILQCHYHDNNGYPRHWRLEGSHNGQTWTELSEEKGDFFQEGHYAYYFEVTNPSPCRYFRLVQLGVNSAGNDRLCLSGLELFGFLYSSFADEMFM